MFITFEGGDGSGKTTQVQRLADWLRAHGHDVLALREPGGTSVGDRARELLLHHRADMDARTELLLFCASRAQLVAEKIRPHLANGGMVVCDRFADSTLAYQGFGRGLDLQFLRTLLRFATHNLTPDLTIYLDIGAEAGIRRRRVNGGEFNRLDAETIDFHQRVREGYRALIADEPARWVVISAEMPLDAIAEQVRAAVERKMRARAT